MAHITQIDWRMQAGREWWSDTETPIWIEMYHDDTLLHRASVEPDVDHGEAATYQWTVRDPDAVEFPHGVHGHLRVRLVAKGDKAWETVDVLSTVHAAEVHHEPGSTDSVHRSACSEAFDFTLDVVPSTDAYEGFQNWTLSY